MAITDLGLLAYGGSRTPNQSTFSVFTTAAVAAGELIVAVTSVDVAGLSSGIDASTYDLRIGGTNGDRFLDRRSNQPGTGSQTGIASSLWWMVAPQAYPSGTEIIAKYNSPTESDHSAIIARHFSVTLGYNVVADSVNTGTITPAGDPPAINVSTGINTPCLRVRSVAGRHLPSTTVSFGVTGGGGWVTFGNILSGSTAGSPDWEVSAFAEMLIINAPGSGASPTSDPSAASACVHTNIYVALKEVPTTGTLAVTERSLVSVGPNLITTPLVWTPSGITITGTTTLTFAENGATAYHSASKLTGSLPAGNYCLSVDYQGTGPSPRNFQAWVFGGSPSHYASCTVAADGTLLDTIVDTPFFTFAQATVTSAGGGFWNVQLTFSTTTTVDEIDLYVIKPPTTQYYLGLNDGSGIQVRNASLRTTTADVANFSGLVLPVITGTLAATEAGDSASFPGGVNIITGTIEAYEGAVWLRADSTLYTADDNVTRVNTAGQIRDIASFSGTVIPGVTGVLAATEGVKDAALFAGQVQWLATLAATEGIDTAAFVGKVGLIGTLAATENADTAAFAGTVAFQAVTGTLAAIETTADTASFTGVAGLITATLAATESADTAGFAGYVAWTGVLAATESTRDTALFTVDLGAVGGLHAIEAGDTPAFTGYLSLVDEKVGVLNAYEDRVGGYSEPRADSTLVTADNTLFHVSIDYFGQDRALFNGEVILNGVMAATEGADVASFAGEVPFAGVMVAVEDRDVAAFDGTVAFAITGVLAAREGSDTARFSEAHVEITGVLAAQESSDFAHFSEAIWVAVEEDNRLKNEVQRTLWLAGRGGRVTWLENEVEDTAFLQNLNPEVVSLTNEVLRITELRP